MAAPHVAGAAAVLFSDTPTATVAEVRRRCWTAATQIARSERQDPHRPAAEPQRGADLARRTSQTRPRRSAPPIRIRRSSASR